MGFSSRHRPKKFHIDSKSPLPMIKVKSYGSWAADTRMEKITFNNFLRNKTECGASQVIFKLNKYESDFYPS